MTRLLLVAILMLPMATIASAAVLYQSNFGSLPAGPAQLPDWNLTGGVYEIRDGWLVVTSEKSNPYATLKARHDADGTFRATVRNARGCHWSALLAKGVYRLEINNQFVRLALHRLTGKEWKLVAEAKSYALYAHNTQEFELRLSFLGSKVYGFIDDKMLIEYEDPEPLPDGGSYGLMSGWGTDLAWRGISLSDAPELSEWPREPTPKPAPEGLLEVTWVRGASSDNIYFDGDAAGLKFKLQTHREGEVKTDLRYRLIDVRQDEVARKSEQVTLTKGEQKELSVEFEPPARGCFKIALDAGTSDEDIGWVEDLGSFTVVPRVLSDAPRNPASYFGGHMDGINLEWHLQAGRKIGIQWARCHDMMQWTWWERIQPTSPNEWVWGDKAQRLVDSLGFSTLGEFCKTPTWASSKQPGDPGHPKQYPPRDWDDFARYVFKTVEHYKGSIKHWEVWNEPHYAGFWRGGPEAYAKLLQIAYREAKRADPECIVIGGGGVWPRGLDWIERMLQAGGAQHMDAFSIHYAEPDIADENLVQLRGLLARHGMTGPIWNTEESVPTTSFLDQLRQGRMEPEARYHFLNACFELVRLYMESISHGVRRLFYYHQADPWRQKQFPKPRGVEPGRIDGGMWEQGRMLKPIAAAHAALALAIENKTYKSRITKGNLEGPPEAAFPPRRDGEVGPPRLEAFIFEGPDSAAAVQYATFDSYARRESVTLKLPRGTSAQDFTIIDFMGNESTPVVADDTLTLPLSREPVYVVCRGERAGDVLRGMYGGAEAAT